MFKILYLYIINWIFGVFIPNNIHVITIIFSILIEDVSIFV
jgi:hypothetical protein